VDVGKRRAVNTVEMVLGETKQKLCDDLTKDRDMPSGVRMVFQSVVGVYFSEVQQVRIGPFTKSRPPCLPMQDSHFFFTIAGGS
jgi:hypothetical protein